MHGKVTKYGGEEGYKYLEMTKLLNSVCLTSERNTYKFRKLVQMGDLDAVRSEDGTRIPLKLTNAV